VALPAVKTGGIFDQDESVDDSTGNADYDGNTDY
jgi:beta-glucosidase